MTYEIIFGVLAALMTLFAIAAFGWRLLRGHDDPKREWARTEENVAALRHEYERARERFDAGKMSKDEFEERENELALRVLDETTPEATKRHVENEAMYPVSTLLALLVVIPAMSIGCYLYYGDFSSLDEDAYDQIEAVRAQAEAEKNILDSVARLEAAVAKDPDTLSAWEILADHYNQTGDLERAQAAYEQVIRLDPKNGLAYAELADVLVANQNGDLTGKVGEYAYKALEIDPWNQKALMIGAAVAFDHADYKKAAMLFKRLQDQFPEGSEVYTAVNHNIEMAKDLGKFTELPKDPVGPKPQKEGMQMMWDAIGQGQPGAQGAPGGMPSGMGGMGGMGGMSGLPPAMESLPPELTGGKK